MPEHDAWESWQTDNAAVKGSDIYAQRKAATEAVCNHRENKLNLCIEQPAQSFPVTSFPSSIVTPNTLSHDDSVPSTPTSAQSSLSSGQSTQKERFLSSLYAMDLSYDTASRIVDMLLSLSKSERAICLFNQAHFIRKVEEALRALEIVDEEDRNL